MDANDLSTLDRNTLRAWRVTNLLGWGFAAAAASLLVIVALFILGRVVMSHYAPSAWVGIPLALFEFAIAAAAGGLVAGAHVYRAPGIVAAAAVGALGVLLVLVISVAGDVGFMLIAGAVAAAEATVAAWVARWRWRRRPSALRGR